VRRFTAHWIFFLVWWFFGFSFFFSVLSRICVWCLRVTLCLLALSLYTRALFLALLLSVVVVALLFILRLRLLHLQSLVRGSIG